VVAWSAPARFQLWSGCVIVVVVVLVVAPAVVVVGVFLSASSLSLCSWCGGICGVIVLAASSPGPSVSSCAAVV
jgi:hypothetical protein